MSDKSERPTIKAAQIGVGRWGRNIARTIRDEIPGIRLIRAVTSREDIGDLIGDECTRVADWRDLLNDDEVEAVFLAVPPSRHREMTSAFVESGIAVFVEKPLCRTDAEADDIAARWARAGNLHLRSNLVLRGAEVYRWLKDAIAAGDFGDIYAFDGDYLYGRLEKITEGWRKDVPDYSVMEGGGVHIIDLMLWLTGETPTQVTVTGNKIATRDTGFQYDDFMAATYRFSSGAVGRITANFGCVHPHHHVIRLFGTKATFIYDDQGPRLFRNRADGAQAEKLGLAPLPAGKGVLIPDFIKAIRTGEDPAPAAMRELDLIRVIAAADRAHAAGTPQPIRTET